MGYWDNITKIYESQTAKGIAEYGQKLEENTELTDPIQIIEEAEQEAVDFLIYLEHAKANIRRFMERVND